MVVQARMAYRAAEDEVCVTVCSIPKPTTTHWAHPFLDHVFSTAGAPEL
jgi:hypothetical protein